MVPDDEEKTEDEEPKEDTRAVDEVEKRMPFLWYG